MIQEQYMNSLRNRDTYHVRLDQIDFEPVGTLKGHSLVFLDKLVF